MAALWTLLARFGRDVTGRLVSGAKFTGATAARPPPPRGGSLGAVTLRRRLQLSCGYGGAQSQSLPPDLGAALWDAPRGASPVRVGPLLGLVAPAVIGGFSSPVVTCCACVQCRNAEVGRAPCPGRACAGEEAKADVRAACSLDTCGGRAWEEWRKCEEGTGAVPTDACRAAHQLLLRRLTWERYGAPV